MPPKQVKIREDPEPEPIETSSNRSKLASLHSHSGKRHVLSWLAGHSRESAGDGPYQMLEDEPSSEGVQAGVRPRAATAAMNVLSAPMDPAIADALRGLRLESPSAMRRKSAGDEKATLFEMVDPAPEDAEGVHKPRSLVKLQRYLRSVIQEWVASCSPATFRVNDPAKLYPLPDFADYGMIQFPARADPARFIHLSASRLPYRSMNSYLKSVLDLMEKHWQMESASVLISITGGAQDFKLQPRLLKAFKHGLAKAAQATNAWVFTGGTDSGVMQLVGEALSETQCSAKMIGVATWACVWGKERLEGCYGGTRDVVRERQNDRNHANLEPHHTHFILVDNGASPQRAFREAFAKAIKVQRWQVTLRVNDGVDVAMPPFHVTIIVSAAGMGEGTNTCNRLRKLSAASLSAALPEGSPVGEISNVEYDSQTFFSTLHCVLSPSVKHFDDNTQWGGEIELRASLEKLYCERRRVPRVTVVVNGGPGTLTTVHTAVMQGCPVVIISDSGGIATCLHEYMSAYSSSANSQAEMRSWEKRYESMYGKKREAWEKMRQEMGEIAREHAAKNKVKSFALSETSTAALDLHLLNAVINDDTQIRAGSRLQLAVQWNRKEVVQSVMINLRNTAPGHDAATTENYVREQVAQALQMAIEREQADIIKMLLVQHEKAIGQLDFLSLYRQDHPLFATSAILTTKLAEGPALNASGKATSIALYKQVLLPFLRDFVPGIHYALAREQDKSATRVKNSRASLKATTTQYFEDGLPHLMLWAVFIGSVELARVFWQQSTKHSDPIRLALIASQASKEAAEVRPSAAQLYLRNADVFEGWAVSVLDKCPTHNKATIVLMRPSHIWPGTILQVAMHGKAKSFVGHKYVQTLIDEYWRGNLYGSDGALPANVGSWRVLLHLFFKTLDKQKVEHNADEFTSHEQRRLAKLRTQQMKISDLLAPNRNASEYYALNAMPRMGTINDGSRSPTLRANGGGKERGGLPQGGMIPIDDALGELPPCCQDPCRDGWLCFPLRCFSCCFNCCFQCCTCLACARCLGGKKGSGAAGRGVGSVFRWLHLRWFLAVPRVKFLLKMTSYVFFMVLYTLVLMSHPGTSITFGMAEFAFCIYCHAFWVEELYQWYTHWCAGHGHFESFANIADVVTLTSQAIASTIRLTVGVAFHTAELGLHTVERLVDERMLAEAQQPHELLAGLGYGSEAGNFNPSSIEFRRLLGDSAAEEHSATRVVWDGLYLGCTPLWMAQVVLAICAIYAYTRMLLWLQIYRDVGVLSIIIQALFKDIIMFGGILLVVMAAFASAFVALMPSLGDATFGTDGAFALPFWAMFGEFGDLHSVGVAGGRLGPCLLWIFSFTTQVVLVNLLIAMMSETYENIKQNADNEWKYSRVFVVDEFVSSVYWIPPPFSLPFLVVEIAHGLSRLAYNGLESFFVRFTNNPQQQPRTFSVPGRMSTTRATGLGYRREAIVVPLLSATLPIAVLDTQTPDRMWLADVLEDEDRKHECATETKIERLSSELSKVLDKSLEIQETLLKLHTFQEVSSRESSSASALNVAPSMSRSTTSLRNMPSSPRMPGPPPPPMAALPPATQAPSPRGRPLAQPSARDVPMKLVGAAAAPPHAALLGPSVATPPSVAESLQHPKGKAQRTLHDELAAKLEAAEHALELTRKVHSVARSQQHPKYPQRFQVPDDMVDWRVRFPGYSPRRFTGAGVEANTSSATNPKGWADPTDPNALREEMKKRKSFEGELFFDAHGRPVNPRGRTGICDRGMLGKWGPNHAADPIVTRWKPGAIPRVLQVVSIRRGDTGIWALPGGMVDADENVSVTVRREFEEEAGNVREGAEREAFNSAVAELFSNGRIVYQGYVDDPRNTDNAWMETTAFHFHCSEELGSKLPLRAGDDANDVTWLDVSVDEPRYVNLYASHRHWVDQVYISMSNGEDALSNPPHKAGKAKRGVFGGIGFRPTNPRPIAPTPPPSPPSSPPGSPRRGSTPLLR